ncbi:threonine-phosphate decarboxylase CobD [Bacillus thermotolerans]|uniref:threonine-phosphate decarboxylase n=1 Tax=Bacillus thermotolerans TaxID=1221996 RepID=A0A0F5I4F6_BACTR|nr:threonine-phosphate decarboxylase CobD [Bacillus thermotolerans]KKB36028.1 L-threonine 3-O-phosphate decarboxylase [Bacillus thermotolerans]KKB40155.1 L-threonine 3-O-phosphate decarboxylase [Bacillus thermotolerans]
MRLPAHGSNPDHLYKAIGLERPLDLIDFSVNTNPFGPPAAIKEHWMEWFSLVADYPDPSGASVIKKLAERNGVQEEQIVLGNGAAEIIQLLAQQWREERIVIVQPAFSEYEAACRTYGCGVEYIFADQLGQIPVNDMIHKAEKAAAIFMCTPNNPTGMVFAREQIVEVLAKTESSGCYVVIDEAFYDFAGSDTFAELLPRYPHLLILRSLTKMYAIAGLRIGYLLSSAETASRVARLRPHWNVNTLALQAAETVLQEEAFEVRTRERIAEERERMFNFLQRESFEHTPSSVNFYLLRDPALDDQRPLFVFLLKKGIVLRHTYNYPGIEGRWLRAAVKTEEENNQLKEALLQWRKQG